MALFSGDRYSYARPELANVTHTHLDLHVDFEQKILKGKAVLTIEREPSITEVVLDNYELVISSVINLNTGSNLEYQIEYSGIYGSKFTIQLPHAVRDTCTIQIGYETSKNSPALYWLMPEQTADGIYPFLLTDSKLTYARAIFPCQDTPSVKFTYSAKISVPRNFNVLTSAVWISKLETAYRCVYEFCQKTKLPSYAVVLAVGVLKYTEINSNIGVWVENKYIQLTKKFSITERILDVAQKLCGPYRWNRYDICVLPPCISHLDIECPCVAFVSPTLLCGDVSLVNSIAQKISQCWTGHLVTCENFEHLWLNKSISTFICRKILGVIFNEEMRLFLLTKGVNDQKDTIENFGISEMKCLIYHFTGLLPNDAAKYVIYEKGCIFLEGLQLLLGGKIIFEAFLKSYVENFALQSINTFIWKNYLYDYFPEEENLLDSVFWDTWFYNKNFSTIQSTSILERACFDLAEKWIKCDLGTLPSFSFKDIQSFCDLQIIVFLNYLRASHTILLENKITLMSCVYRFDENYNCEIRFAWLRLCIKSRCLLKIIPSLSFAIYFCSPKYACPIFRDLYEWIDARPIAVMKYMNYKWLMPDETRKELETILHLNNETNVS